jgi:polysaccharide biosynthesis protein PslG
LSVPRSSRPGRALAVLVALLLACSAAIALAAGPASARDVRIRHSLFGLHDGSLEAGNTIHPGSVRLWDVGVTWQDIETSRHHYNWSVLDNLVTSAQQHHQQVLMVVAMTPRFYASSPTRPPHRIAAYKDFVRALMKRYRNFHGSRGIGAYQVWNESNISTFWTGTVGQMAQLTRAMDEVRDNVDPHATVVAPAMVTRLPYEMKGLSTYYRQRVAGRAVWRYVDAVSVSLYPLPRVGGHLAVPEDSIRLLKAVKSRLAHAGVPRSKAIWNTEINYGLQTGSKGGTAAARISAARQASNVVRTYLLNAANGVKRVFWYRYDWASLAGGGTIGNTLLTNPNRISSVSPAGHAYARVQSWMHGTLVGSKHRAPCAKDRHGTYRCVVRDKTGTRSIYWNPFGTATVRLPRGVHHLQGVLGGVQSVKPHATIRVGYKPVMAYR